MPRLVIDLRRTADPTNAITPTASVANYATEPGVFDVKLPSPLRNVRRVAIEGYTAAGIQLISADNAAPTQPYLAVIFDNMRAYDDELPVARCDRTQPLADRDQPSTEKGFALPIEEGPWFHRHLDLAVSRLLFHGDERTTHIEHLKVRVRGPNNEVPLFSRLTLFLRVEIDADAPVHSAVPSVMAGVNSEVVPGGRYAVTGVRGAIYQ